MSTFGDSKEVIKLESIIIISKHSFWRNLELPRENQQFSREWSAKEDHAIEAMNK